MWLGKIITNYLCLILVHQNVLMNLAMGLIKLHQIFWEISFLCFSPPLGHSCSTGYLVSIDCFRIPMLSFFAQSWSNHEILTKYIILYSEIPKLSRFDAYYFHEVFYNEWQNSTIYNIICQSLHWLPSCGSSTNNFQALCVCSAPAQCHGCCI